MFNEEREKILCVSNVWGVRISIRCPDVGSYYFVVMFRDFWETCIGVSNESEDVDKRDGR